MDWFYLAVWLAGLIGLPLAVFIYSKAVQLETTQDTGHVRQITGWGMVLTGFWFVVGGLIIAVALLSQATGGH